MSWLSHLKRKSFRRSKKAQSSNSGQKNSPEVTATASTMTTPDVASAEVKAVPSVVVTEPPDGAERGVSPTVPTAVERPTKSNTVSRPKKLRSQPLSDASDVGYSSRSTLAADDPFRGRTSTESSGSSMYYSASSNSSPTNSTDISPIFPAVEPPPHKPSERELLQSINERLEKMENLVKNLQTSIDGLSVRVGCIEEKIEHLRPRAISAETQTMELRTCSSLPDISVLPNTACDKKVILWLVQKVVDWKFLARWLDLEDNEISRIETDNAKSDREQCYQMFVRWKAVKPENYTYHALGYALQKESQELYYEYVKEVYRIEND